MQRQHQDRQQGKHALLGTSDPCMLAQMSPHLFSTFRSPMVAGLGGRRDELKYCAERAGLCGQPQRRHAWHLPPTNPTLQLRSEDSSICLLQRDARTGAAGGIRKCTHIIAMQPEKAEMAGSRQGSLESTGVLIGGDLGRRTSSGGLQDSRVSWKKKPTWPSRLCPGTGPVVLWHKPSKPIKLDAFTRSTPCCCIAQFATGVQHPAAVMGQSQVCGWLGHPVSRRGDRWAHQAQVQERAKLRLSGINHP